MSVVGSSIAKNPTAFATRTDASGGDLRQDILSAIRRAPGIHKSALCRNVDCGWGTVGYHVQHLLRAGKIAGMNWDGRTVLFPSGLDRVDREQLAVYRMDLSRPIMDALDAEASSPLDEVASRIGRSVRATRRHLKALREVGLIEQLGVHRPRYRLSDCGVRLRATTA